MRRAGLRLRSPGSLLNTCARAALIGLLASFAAPAAHAQDMTFRAVAPANCRAPCVPELIADGAIGLDTADAFRAAAARLGGRPVVRIASGGGNLVGALRLGQAFRKAGAAVIVGKGARCVSACVYAFLGGVSRQVASGGRVGVHRFYPAEDTEGGDFPAVLVRRATETLTEYVAQMGADPDLVRLALEVSPPAVRFFTAAELRRYRVTN
jgi:hypothetical protein